MSFLQDFRDFFHPTEKGFFFGMVSGLVFNGSMIRDGVLLTKVPQWRVDRTTQDDEIEIFQAKIPNLIPIDMCLREFSTP